jgi:adenylate cyclase
MVARARDHTFAFADLAGFTALTEAMGDEDAASLVAEFCEAVGALLTDHGAEQIKAIGDALLIRADRADRAVELGVRIVQDVGGRHYFPAVRVGMHTGPAVERDGDWFGHTVNIAARVSGEASGGDVLVTDATRAAAGVVERIEFRERGRRRLRNVAEPLLLFSAVREGGLADGGLPIDPVCRMAVDPAHAAGRLTYAGAGYYFCSLDCAQKFASQPESYTGSD